MLEGVWWWWGFEALRVHVPTGGGRRFAVDGTTALQRHCDSSSFSGATAKLLARAVKRLCLRAYRLVLHRSDHVIKKKYLTTTGDCIGFATFWCSWSET